MWDCSIADLHCIIMCSFVYAAVEAIIISRTILKKHFYKASKYHRLILQTKNLYGVVTCLSLDRYNML